MLPEADPTKSFLPSAEDATQFQIGRLPKPLLVQTFIQVEPELVEAYMVMLISLAKSCPMTATSLTPSAEEATPCQLLLIEVVRVQVVPELEEV